MSERSAVSVPVPAQGWPGVREVVAGGETFYQCDGLNVRAAHLDSLAVTVAAIIRHRGETS